MAKEQEYSKLFDKSGGFKKLLGYQIAELLYDFTVRFTERYIPAGSRTRDQMEQAARSGSQNIAEGSVFSATSKKFEMNLTNVSRASLTELQKDYAAFLRQRKLTIWTSSDPIRQELVDMRFTVVDEVARWAKNVNARHPERTIPEIAGNIGYIYSNVALALVKRQLNSQARAFEKEGGFSERLYKFRSRRRGTTNESDRSPTPPAASHPKSAPATAAPSFSLGWHKVSRFGGIMARRHHNPSGACPSFVRTSLLLGRILRSSIHPSSRLVWPNDGHACHPLEIL